MAKLIDKAGILAVCLVIYFIHDDFPYMIIPILLVVIISALNSYFQKHTHVITGIIAYSGAAIFFPGMVYFILLLCFDCFSEKYYPVAFIIPIVREVLANIMKHSDASQVTLTAREHPGLYQVIVSDNGST